jgi:hypothetical protein
VWPLKRFPVLVEAGRTVLGGSCIIQCLQHPPGAEQIQNTGGRLVTVGQGSTGDHQHGQQSQAERQRRVTRHAWHASKP